ncbi:MAG: elongation factor G [Thermodesulfovibrionales bacterium]|nr:elongation factor G [Thermodesulfovibrionales bacterium]
MANFDVNKIRNVAVIAHGGAGKTSLVEAMLFDSGAIDRLGSIEEGNTTTDSEPEEISRKITIISALGFCNWNGHRINLIDTPGFINFVEDIRGTLKAVDGAVVIVSAISGVKAETEKVWKYACEYEIPRIVFINKLDKESANFVGALEELAQSFGSEGVPLQIPIGSGEKFEGIINLINMKAYKFSGGKASESDIPADMLSEAQEYRKKLIEKIAESDDSLLEKYLEGGELTQEEIIKGIKEGSLSRRFIPVACGSAVKNIGIPQLLDTILLCLPSPIDLVRIFPVKGKNPKDGTDVQRKPDEKEPFSAYIFKTIADPYAGKLSLFRVYSGTLKADSTVLNSTVGSKERIGQVFYLLGKKQIPANTIGAGEIGVVAKLKETNTGDTLSDEAHPIVFEKVKFAEPIISYAIAPKSKGDEDKVSTGLSRILEEDPTLKFHRDEETKEMILSGMGQVHLEVTLERLKRKFGVEVVMKTPKIPYKETIKAPAKAQGRYKKQSGGRGQYGDCHITIEPMQRGKGFEFVDKVVGGAIPRQYIPAVEKGIVDTMREGIIAGYPMVDVRVSLYDGSYHTVDSSEMAFKIAGSMAIKKAVEDAKPILLEPIMKVEVTTPDEALGAVIGDLNSKRGKVQGVESQARNQKIAALVPMSELLTYANQLHSLTSGRGLYSMEFSHYEEVPAHQAQKVIAEKTAQKKEKAEEK